MQSYKVYRVAELFSLIVKFDLAMRIIQNPITTNYSELILIAI